MPETRLILASTSKARAALLRQLELEFDQVAPDFDERSLDREFPALGPEAYALRQAEGKALSVAALHPNAAVLAADQVAVVGDPAELLTKPGSKDDAVAQLMRLSGRGHRLVNGVALAIDGRLRTEVDVQTLTMRAFDEDEARAYVERFSPLECVGSYRIEDAGVKLFESISGHDQTGIVGLPLLASCRLLRLEGLLTP